MLTISTNEVKRALANLPEYVPFSHKALTMFVRKFYNDNLWVSENRMNRALSDCCGKFIETNGSFNGVKYFWRVSEKNA